MLQNIKWLIAVVIVVVDRFAVLFVEPFVESLVQFVVCIAASVFNMAMEEEKHNVDEESKIAGGTARWFDYTRQRVPKLVSDYACVRVQRQFAEADQQFVLKYSTDPSGVTMQWLGLASCPGTAFIGNTTPGGQFADVLYGKFTEFRIRSIRFTLTPYGVEPHMNAVRVETVILFPSQPFIRSSGVPYDPSVASEYPKYTDLRDCDEFLAHAGKANDRMIELAYIPQNITNAWSSVPYNYGSMQNAWLPTTVLNKGVTHLAPWIGWRRPYAAAESECARYTVYQEAFVEFRNPKGDSF